MMQIAIAAVALAALVLHFVGKKHPLAEKVAEGLDEADDVAKKL